MLITVTAGVSPHERRGGLAEPLLEGVMRLEFRHLDAVDGRPRLSLLPDFGFPLRSFREIRIGLERHAHMLAAFICSLAIVQEVQIENVP